MPRWACSASRVRAPRPVRTAIASHGCQVEFAVKFEFRNRLSGLLFEPLFAQTIGSLVDAFVQRARAPA